MSIKKKSDYAFVITCNPGYGFGMIATMNAQKYFGTDADWEIGYEDYTDEERQKISEAFPFNVNWTPISDLLKDMVDKRTDQSCPLHRFWCTYWILAHRLLKEKKYKAVCVIQADTFVFVNLNVFFKIAEAGILSCTEYPMSFINAEDLPFGNDRKVTDRCHLGVFDAVNFLGQDHTRIAEDAYLLQGEDPFERESNGSVVALDRAICRHGSRDKILRLDRHLWVCDGLWHKTRFDLNGTGDRIFNQVMVQINAWHTRYWQEGRAVADWIGMKQIILQNKDNKDFMKEMDNVEHDQNIMKTFMERFNNMIPEIASDYYVKGPILRPRYELGEQ